MPALLARDESQQPSRRNRAGFVLSSEAAMIKQCTKCNETKAESEFRPRISWCRVCEAENARAYRLNHHDGAKARDHVRYLKHADRRRAYAKKWAEENKESRRAYKRNDKARADRRIRYQRDKSKAKIQATQWNRLNPDRVKARIHRRRAKIKGNGGTFTATEWQFLCLKYDYRCLRCGKREPHIKLTIDHIQPIHLGGANTIDNLQPLCLTCNISKGATYADYRPDRTNNLQVEQLSLW
jgi:5-methylcytosine-specific restriction endonuclease McrA